jgi:hypothetical protein
MQGTGIMAHPAGILEPLSHERALDILSKLSKITFINLCTRGVAMSDISETADLEMQIEALIRQASDLLQQQLEDVRRIVGSTPVESQEPVMTE